MPVRKGKFTPGEYNLITKRSKTGIGLFTLDPIKKGACIIQYVGREISEREKIYSRGKYLLEINSKITIDGSAKTNTARYINHSCRPNCELEIWRGGAYILAKKNIKAGEELNYDYDTEYFDAYIKPRGCKCIKCHK
ncbi:MAG: SET domain-containing protein-lysine N-methyltransferase [Candidatus Paceibacterota bacterium]|jgi:hypothetical protein